MAIGLGSELKPRIGLGLGLGLGLGWLPSQNLVSVSELSVRDGVHDALPHRLEHNPFSGVHLEGRVGFGSRES